MVEWRDPLPNELWDRAVDLHVRPGVGGLSSRKHIYEQHELGVAEVWVCTRESKWDMTRCGEVFDETMMKDRTTAIVNVDHWRLADAASAHATYVAELSRGYLGDAELFVFHDNVDPRDRCQNCGKDVRPSVNLLR